MGNRSSSHVGNQFSRVAKVMEAAVDKGDAKLLKPVARFMPTWLPARISLIAADFLVAALSSAFIVTGCSWAKDWKQLCVAVANA
ncbi:MAG TPA: hypothetical protein VL361_09055 [Candidatus Limnocylindrales bacterium]|jgi:hypothetical protein|nr:hypothetical protein [Candidatus Limnocylindrales bacterium]